MTINHIVSIDHGSYGFIARKTGKVHLEKDDKAMISSDRGWYAGRRLPLHRAGGVAMDPQKQGHCWYFCQSICQVTIIFDKSWPSPATLSLFSTDHSCSRCLTHEQTQKWAWRHAKSFKQSPLSCRNGRSIRFSFEKKTHFFSNNPFLIEKTLFFPSQGGDFGPNGWCWTSKESSMNGDDERPWGLRASRNCQTWSFVADVAVSVLWSSSFISVISGS